MGVSSSGWKWRAACAAAILLFAFLLLFRLGIPQKLHISPAARGTADQVGISPAETWMTITQAGRKIGYAHRSLSKQEEGFRFDEELFMRINTMGVVQPLTIRTEAELREDRRLASFQFDLTSNLFRFRVQGKVAGRELTVRIGAPGEERTTHIFLEEIPYLGGGIIASVGAAGLKPGEGRSFPIFDPASLGQREAKITLIGEEKVMIGGVSHPARRLSVDFMGMKQTAWVDRDGGVLREEGIMGIALERAVKEEALAGLEGAMSADLTEIASLPSSRPIADPEALRSLKVRLKGLSEGGFFLDGGRQTYREGVLTIRRETDGPYEVPMIAQEELSPFLKATPFVQSDHPKIRKVLESIVGPGDPEGAKARKLVAWVHKSLEKRPVLSVPNALETLENRVGDCNEHAVLLAALARAAGIPADMEAGLVYLRGRFYYHAWNVLYLKERRGWMTADAVLGQMPTDVTHIRFVRGTAERQLGLAGLIGRLQLEILEMER